MYTIPLPDLNNRENNKNIDRAKYFGTILRRTIDLLCHKWLLDHMRTSREYRHWGREFYSMKDEFCSFNCVTQRSS